MFTCYAIGNPLVDLITEVDTDILDRFELTKGNFHSLTFEKANELFQLVSEKGYQPVPGDASANTVCGISCFRESAVYSGGIGNDKGGQVFSKSLEKMGIQCKLGTYEDPTGYVVVLITPDADRTFGVYLGSSLLLKPDVVDADDLRKSKFLYFTGYQFEPEGLRQVVAEAVDACREAVTMVAMDLADPGIVSRTRDDLKKFVHDNVDMLFANEMTARQYAGCEDDREALEELGKDAPQVFLTMGEQGSLIKNNETVIKVAPNTVTPVDTTGAGDMYSAAILACLSKGYDLERCGRIASFAAAQIIQQKGARIRKDFTQEIENI